MPKLSKADTQGNDLGPPGIEWAAKLDGYTVNIVQIKAEADLTPLLQGLPNDECPSPHWGYVTKGRMWFRSKGKDESFGPGDAFYVAPGHTSGADGGSEFVIFSPTEILDEVEAHMAKRAQELFGA
jgi:hypothetical protein